MKVQQTMLDQLTTEANNPASTHLDRLTPLEFVQLMNREDDAAVQAVGRETTAIAKAIEAVTARLSAGGRLVYIGAGTSGRLGVLDASECPPTFNSPPEMVVGLIAGGDPALRRAIEGAEDSPEQGAADLANITINSRDVVVGIASSGRTPYVLGGLRHARAVGALTIGLTCNRPSALDTEADQVIAPVVGPEVLAGSTRLKAGTATKMVLNMISTGVMVGLGKVYGNLMVDVRTTNEKLKERALRIVERLTELSREEAQAALDAAGGEVKLALVMINRGLDIELARQVLAEARGRLAVALGEIEE